MKLTIAAALLLIGNALKWDRLKVPPQARGDINEEEHYWTGHLTECDNQCVEQGGSVCGQNQRQCCQPDACGQSFGMEVCQELFAFKCKPYEQSPYRLKQTLPPETYPELAHLYH